MSRKYFGTDGVRGVANKKLTPELAFKIGRAAGMYMVNNGLTPRVVIGRDTRRSGPMLGAACAAGFCSVGVDVDDVDIAPTGCVSWLCRNNGYGLAVVISASHNPAPDNGIKLIASSGAKVADAVEEWIEENLETTLEEPPIGGGVGVVTHTRDGIEAYMKWLETLVPERLEGMKVAVDGAHGAAYELGPQIFRRLGADVVETGIQPNGLNINEEGGATKPETVEELTRRLDCIVGIAFDGDADRAVFSDSEGRLINGDRTMAMWCAHWQKLGELTPPVVVGTVMSNGGFETYMKSCGITLERANVGDKYVSMKLKELGGKIGGEQSGHIIFPKNGPTGDGLVTALELLRVLKRENRKASESFDDFANWPQLLVNVELGSKDGWDTDPQIAEAMKMAEAKLQGRGRVNVRASGTQPIVRVMVEADDEALRDECSTQIVDAMINARNGRIYSRVDLTHALGD